MNIILNANGFFCNFRRIESQNICATDMREEINYIIKDSQQDSWLFFSYMKNNFVRWYIMYRQGASVFSSIIRLERLKWRRITNCLSLIGKVGKEKHSMLTHLAKSSFRSRTSSSAEH
jgi:hypothetical protein